MNVIGSGWSFAGGHALDQKAFLFYIVLYQVYGEQDCLFI